MNVGILGLGLIGGSFARAYAKAGHEVFAYVRRKEMLDFAMLAGAVHGRLDPETIPQCDLIILAIFPDGCVDWLKENAKYIAPNTLVMDAGGVKKSVCTPCFALAEEYGFTFMGGHPMAGTQFSGFKHSTADMFEGQPMVLVPHRFDDLTLLQRAKDALKPCGFGSFSVTTAENHDRMIAFTSQMPHIVSNAFIKSPTAMEHSGFSAGSYKDLTRVAWLNPNMWAELFLNNKENVLSELDYFMNSLQQYRDAVANDDADALIALLDEGRKRKEQVDG